MIFYLIFSTFCVLLFTTTFYSLPHTSSVAKEVTASSAKTGAASGFYTEGDGFGCETEGRGVRVRYRGEDRGRIGDASGSYTEGGQRLWPHGVLVEWCRGGRCATMLLCA